MKVALLITCLTDTYYPRTGIAAVKVLEHLGCEVEFPEAQTCCGQPMWNTGHHEGVGGAIELAKRTIEIFEPFDHVVTPSASCAAMIRDYYATMFADEPAWQSRARAMVAKTREFIEFLVRDLEVDLSAHQVRWPGHVTCHRACHLRGLGMSDEAEQLMAHIEGLTCTPLARAEQCCGFGGTFAVKYPSVSGTMVRDKVGCIQATGAEAVVSNDAGCTMNLSGACRREGVDVRFLSLAEILAEGMGLMA